MIFVGNSRGNGQNLAQHLMSSENEHVTLHEITGFANDELSGALKEAEAISKGTKCKKYLYSLSLNPPSKERVETEVFLDAIAKVEQKLGFEGQPRAIVFHEKEGRRHCHVVWSRIDAQAMKAIDMVYPKRKLMDVSKDLFLEHGWELPKGMINPKYRDPKNFTLEQWQHSQLAKTVSPALERLKQLQSEKHNRLKKQQEAMLWRLADKHALKRKSLVARQENRTFQEIQMRQERFNKGLRGLFDRITGAHSKIKRQNGLEAYEATKRDQKQRDALIFKQSEQRKQLALKSGKILQKSVSLGKQLANDLDRMSLKGKKSPQGQDGPSR